MSHHNQSFLHIDAGDSTVEHIIHVREEGQRFTLEFKETRPDLRAWIAQVIDALCTMENHYQATGARHAADIRDLILDSADRASVQANQEIQLLALRAKVRRLEDILEAQQPRVRSLELSMKLHDRANADLWRRHFRSLRKPVRQQIINAHLDAAKDVCLRCGYSPPPGEALVVDHALALRYGAPADILNIQPLCERCNAEKGDRLDPAWDFRTEDYHQRLVEACIRHGLSQLVMFEVNRAQHPLWTPPSNGHKAHGPG